MRSWFAIELRRVRRDWRPAVVALALQPLVVVLINQVGFLQELPGIVLVVDGLLVYYLCGVAIGAVSTVVLAAALLAVGIDKRQDVTAVGIVVGLLVIGVAGGAVSWVSESRRTAEREAENSLRRARQLLDAAFDAVALSVEGIVVEANDGFEHLAGVGPGKAVGLNL